MADIMAIVSLHLLHHPMHTPLLILICTIAATLPLAKCGGGWLMTFEDDFDGPELNASIWNIHDNATHGSEELQLYVADEVYLENSCLVLRTRERKAWHGGVQYNFTSGWVDTKEHMYQLYGRFEVVAKLPVQNAGIWPAHWLMPNPSTSHPPQVCWPVGGEIDVMEMVGSKGEKVPVLGTYHWAKECGKDLYDGHNGHYPAAGQKPIVWDEAFHRFAVEWTEKSIVWEVDGHQYHTRDASSCILPVSAMHIILNTAIAPWNYQAGTWPVYHLSA